jgi:hypothetical protein
MDLSFSSLATQPRHPEAGNALPASAEEFIARASHSAVLQSPEFDRDIRAFIDERVKIAGN